jgi:hypothetical protein
MSSLTVTLDSARPALQRLAGIVGNRGVNKTLGIALKKTVKRHFRSRSARPNALGGATTQFWERAADGTRSEADDAGATVSMQVAGYSGNGNPIAQRLFGGTIFARPGHALAIPVNPDVHGIPAREARRGGNTKLIPFGKGQGNRLGIIVRTRDGKSTGEILYILLSKVTQKPDPTVLPDDETLKTAAYTAVEDAALNAFEGTSKP